jgi:signal transduction histidine kinase
VSWSRPLDIALEWDFIAMPDLPSIAPERTLHVLRILQELIVNAIRHSGAHRIVVTCRRNDNSVTLEIRDDGSGFDPDRLATGRGLGNLRRRAEALGGQVGWARAGSGGTHAWLRLPLAATIMPSGISSLDDTAGRARERAQHE